MNAPHKGLFDLWSRFYDAPLVQRATYHPVHDAVLRALEQGPPRTILDVGCGTGQLAARLRRVFPRRTVVGCDFSAGMLKHAAQRDPRGWWVGADAARLPFADGRTLGRAGFRAIIQQRVGRLPGALLFPAVLSIAEKRP